MTEPKPIAFATIGDPLNLLLRELGNKLSREWPAKYAKVTGARELFVMHMRAAQQTFHAALYLCGDLPPDPHRKPEFAICLPLFNRALLDSLFTLMFIMEDVPSRCSWFWEADWKENKLDFDRCSVEYGHEPEWQPWLKILDKYCQMGIEHANLTPEQVADPAKLRSWLNPGALWQNGVSRDNLPPNRAFLKFLYDFFYIDLSQQAHLAGPGVVKRGTILLDSVRNKDDADLQRLKLRNKGIGQTITFTLAIASEVQDHFKFDLEQNLPYIWTITASSISVAEEMNKKRYRDLFGGVNA
jgi:hypothetical protein